MSGQQRSTRCVNPAIRPLKTPGPRNREIRPMSHYIGLDLGGTNIKSCIINRDGDVLAERSVPTDADKGPDAVVDRLIESAHVVAEAANLKLTDITGVGVGAPGPLDAKKQIVVNAPNLPGFINVPLVARIREATGRPTVLENDANAAAYGEYAFGVGRDPNIRHLVLLALGTGVGGGVVVDGRIISGAFGLGAELGHLLMHPGGRLCACGQHGCLEAYASASSAERFAVEAVEAGKKTSLQKVHAAGRITAKDVFDAAKAGDQVADEVVDQLCANLGSACVSFCRIFDPQMIVLAGGLILAGDTLVKRVEHHYQKLTWTIAENRVRIVLATLGERAGRIGAAAEAMQAFGDNAL